jgi:hypothetical protein
VISFSFFVIAYRFYNREHIVAENQLLNREILEQDLPLASDVTLTLKPIAFATCYTIAGPIQSPLPAAQS